MQHEYVAQAQDLRLNSKKNLDVSAESVKELKKLNKHMGAIEGKVSELHKQYDELKEQAGANS
jgi:cell shape-determining protein MreC